MDNSEKGDTKNLAALVDRAFQDTKLFEQPLHIAQRLSEWGVVYSVLGDREAGNILFNRALSVISYGAHNPETYVHGYLQEISSIQEHIRVEEPLVKLPREAIVGMPIGEFRFLQGMVQDYYKVMYSGIELPYFMKSV